MPHCLRLAALYLFVLTHYMNRRFAPKRPCWRTLRSVRIRRTWIFRRPYAQLKFDGGSKNTRTVLRLPLHLLADADRAETLSILRRRAQSSGADWRE